MIRFLCVCLGGALGTGARYLLSTWLERATPSEFPYGTLLVNVLGSFLLGLVMQVALAMDPLSPTLRLSLTAGVLGGFTTYSTFNYEAVESLRGGSFGLAALYVGTTVGACLLAGFLGVASGRLLLER